MGMYDYLICEYPLPQPDGVERVFQTKDTPAQSLDTYTIREDGSLWGEEYDIEDQSDPNAEGLMALYGCATKVNHRPKKCEMTGEVRFYAFHEEPKAVGWLEYSAYFKDGQIQMLNLIECREGPPHL